MTHPRDDIVWTWNTTDLSAAEIGRQHGLSRSVILGIVHRDPRAKSRRPPLAIQLQRRIKALKIEMKRLQRLEAVASRRTGVKKGKQALMEAQFWKAMRRALYEEQGQTSEASPAHMKRKTAA